VSTVEARRRGNQAYRTRHRQLGLCVDCPRPVVLALRCASHYLAAQEGKAARRKALTAPG
jgi:hypothetical protein